MNRLLKNLAQKIDAPALTPEKRAEIEARVVWAASEDDLGEVKAHLGLLAAAGVSRVKARDEGRRTALAWAAANGNAEGMRLLAPWCDPCAVSADGDNVLMEAARNGDAGCILFAVELARDRHLKKRSSVNSDTALHAAARGGCADPAALRALAELVGANALDHQGATALHLAAWTASPGAVRSLMEICDPLALDEMGGTALVNAIITYSPGEEEALECVKLLASVCPVNALNKNGTTPLLIAANADDDRPLRALMHRADWAVKDSRGRDAFDLAAETANQQKRFACLDTLCAVFPLERVEREIERQGTKSWPAGLARVEEHELRSVVENGAIEGKEPSSIQAESVAEARETKKSATGKIDSGVAVARRAASRL